jgi:acetate kinase
MKVLVLNCGSSSLKFQVFHEETMTVIARGSVNRIASGDSEVVAEIGGRRGVEHQTIADHDAALRVVMDALSQAAGIEKEREAIGAVGHRVVHGGESFRGATQVTPEVVEQIERCVPLAPLHNPPALAGIRGALRLLPGVPHVAVFDTAFHADMPEVAHLYALPYEYFAKHGVRRYGFHGLSFDYVLQRVQELGEGRTWTRVVIAHLGNGASIAAIHRDRSIDTSMGMTPLEGLVMGSRCGDLDPGVIIFLQEHLGLSVDDVGRLLNKESGLLGLSGFSNDVRDLERRANRGDYRARLALELFSYRVKKYIGAYAASLGGLDVIAFTGGIGENCSRIRAAACEGLGFLGIDLDPDANASEHTGEREISRRDSAVRVLVVPTDEERLIAEETIALVRPGLRTAAV